MTLEELLGMSSTQWEQLPTEELQKWAQQFFTVTRPDAAKIAERKVEEKKVKTTTPKLKTHDFDKALQQAEILRKALGI